MDKIVLGLMKWVKAKLDEDWDQPIVHDLVEALNLGPVRDEKTDMMGAGVKRLYEAAQKYIEVMDS